MTDVNSGSNPTYSPISGSDNAWFAGMTTWEDRPGEGLQQKLQTPSERGFFDFDFDYFVPCDKFDYRLTLFLSTKKDLRGDTIRLANIVLDGDSAGSWKHYSRRMHINKQKKWDWFLLRLEFPVGFTSHNDTNYVYIDMVDFHESPCDDCGPTGDISYNKIFPGHFSPNNDGYNDQFCFSDINNVDHYEIKVYDNQNSLQWQTSGDDANGFYNKCVCWDGIKTEGTNQGTVIPAGSYYATIKLENCTHNGRDAIEDRYTFFTGGNGPPVFPEPLPVQYSYTPNSYSHPVAPFARDVVQLYGYYNNAQWFRACDSVFVGSSCNFLTDFFTADSSANINIRAGEEVILTDGASLHPGAEVTILIDSNWKCCPKFGPNKVAESDFSISGTDTIAANFPEIQPKTKEQDTNQIHKLKVFPNPAESVLQVELPLAEGTLLLRNVAGAEWRYKVTGPQMELGVSGFPAGVYFLSWKLNGELTCRRIAIVH